MKTRPYSERDLLGTKAAFRDLVDALGGLHAAATVTRVGPSKLAAYYHPQMGGVFPPADVVADLEAVAELPLVTAELARLAGYTLIRLERPDSAALAAAIAVSARESAEVTAAFLDGMEDGRICTIDAEHVQREALQAANALNQVAAIAGAQIQAAGVPAAAIRCGSGDGLPGAVVA